MASKLPLAGVNVLDFMWVLAGPGITRSLADYGATVVRVEATTRPDAVRTVGPFKDNLVTHEGSALWWNNNAGKYGITLDMANPAARAVVHDLVRWADVVSESFSPKAMRGWDLDYESLKKIKPDIIMMSSCLMGQTGPLSRFAGFGNLAAALCGFYNLVGWPDRPPSGPFSAYTDYIAPRFGLVALMAALIHRKRTGEGQHVDQAQAESALHFLTVPIVDNAANGREYRPVGNYDAEHAPHGVYPAAGDDRWVAIACRTEEQWRALCASMDQPALAQDPRYQNIAGRQRARDTLDLAISEWTRHLNPQAVERRLQAVGIAAHTVQNTFDMASDPQLTDRDHFLEVPHGTLGATCVENSRFRLLRTPAQVTRGACALGEHNQFVLGQLLGYSEERVSELAVEGIFG